ncbi:unnamed protein product [Heterobilharzia americana]|nr:unnamed protein product [Heterobilharzia americana]
MRDTVEFCVSTCFVIGGDDDVAVTLMNILISGCLCSHGFGCSIVCRVYMRDTVEFCVSTCFVIGGDDDVAVTLMNILISGCLCSHGCE